MTTPKNLLLKKLSIYPSTLTSYLADPGKARGCSTNSLMIHKLIKSVTLFLPQLYGAATPKRLEIELPVIKLTMS